MNDNATPPPSPEETAASEQPRSAFATAAKVVRAVQLHSVRFGAFSAHALENVDAIPEADTFSVTTKFLRPSVDVTENGFATRTTLLFRLGPTQSGEASSSKPYAVIQATLSASYGLKPDSPEFSKDDLADYALCYCPFHVWGYWREFVQSSLARLDLPQVTIPLFLINQAPEMVQDSLD